LDGSYTLWSSANNSFVIGCKLWFIPTQWSNVAELVSNGCRSSFTEERFLSVSENPPKKNTRAERDESISMQEFLQDVPPNEQRTISGCFDRHQEPATYATPDLTLSCADPLCGRPQTFRCVDKRSI